MGQDESVMIHDDTPCSRCGYSLRTLRRDGNCPECGQPVATSLLKVDERRLIVLEDKLIAAADDLRHRRRAALVIGWSAAIGLSLLGYMLLLSDSLPDDATPAVSNVGLIIGIAILLYSRVCNVRLQHVEYVRHCRATGDGSRPPRQRRFDDRILKRMNYYERNINASGCLIALMVFPLILIAGMMLTTGFPVDRLLKSGLIVVIVSPILYGVLWGMLLFVNRSRLDHARSIKYYRHVQN